jgi:DNA (cytosine-5)-methyltransferase 1
MGGGQGAKTGLYAVTIEKHRGSFRRFINQTIFGALTASYYKGIRGAGRPAVLHNKRVRRLTPLECERLMGLEDEWTGVGISDTQRYKLCGNGVVINCVDYILNLVDKL